MTQVDWKNSAFFEQSEFLCSHTNQEKMDQGFINTLNELREKFDKPIYITSGYRDVTHPIEIVKGKGGAHTSGKAVDISVSRKDAYTLLKIAFELQFTGIGINQKGNSRFIHLDTIESSPDRPRPTIWSY